MQAANLEGVRRHAVRLEQLRWSEERRELPSSAKIRISNLLNVFRRFHAIYIQFLAAFRLRRGVCHDSNHLEKSILISCFVRHRLSSSLEVNGFHKRVYQFYVFVGTCPEVFGSKAFQANKADGGATTTTAAFDWRF